MRFVGKIGYGGEELDRITEDEEGVAWDHWSGKGEKHWGWKWGIGRYGEKVGVWNSGVLPEVGVGIGENRGWSLGSGSGESGRNSHKWTGNMG